MAKASSSSVDSINPSELFSVLNHCYETSPKTAVMIEGAHGIGKSSVMQQWAEQKGIGFKVIDLSLIEPVDLTGLPYITGEGITRYAKSELLPTDQDPACGILVFEELNRCPAATRNPTLQLLTSGKLNSYALPKGWIIACCINPSNDQYDVDELCPALLDRFLKVKLVKDYGVWKHWAQGVGVDNRVLGFIDQNRVRFNACTPRTWNRISNLIKGKKGVDVATMGIKFFIAAGLDALNAQEFINRVEAGDPVDVVQFFNDPTQGLADLKKIINDHDFGKMDIAVQSILSYEKTYKRRPAKVLEAVDQMLLLLPSDYRMKLGQEGNFRLLNA